jgi:hypothetical protein
VQWAGALLNCEKGMCFRKSPIHFQTGGAARPRTYLGSEPIFLFATPFIFLRRFLGKRAWLGRRGFEPTLTTMVMSPAIPFFSLAR